MFFVIDMIEDDAIGAPGKGFQGCVHLLDRRPSPARNDQGVIGKVAHCPGIPHSKGGRSIDDQEVEVVLQLR